jgi:hypothetical protein
MTNADIRKKALSKVKVKNLTLMAVLSGLLIWISQFASGLTGAAPTDAVLAAGTALLVSLVFPGGLAQAAMTAWRQNEARFSTFFSCFFRPRFLLGGLVLGLAAALCRVLLSLLLTDAVLARLDPLPGHGLWVFFIGAALLVPLFFVWLFLYFALALQPEENIFAALGRGLSVALKNLGRILLMELSILWWVALAWIGAVAVSMLSGLGGAALNAVASLVALMLAWMIGSYVCLVNAGLAREIFKS